MLFFFNRTAPKPVFDASTDILVSNAGLKYLSTGLCVISFFMHSNDNSCCSVQFHATSSCKRCLKGGETDDKLGKNFPKYHLNFIRFYSICRKSMSKNVNSCTQNTHFSLFNFKFGSLILSRTALSLSSCSSFDWPQTIISSWLFLQPSRPSIISLIFR